MAHFSICFSRWPDFYFYFIGHSTIVLKIEPRFVTLTGSNKGDIFVSYQVYRSKVICLSKSRATYDTYIM